MATSLGLFAVRAGGALRLIGAAVTDVRRAAVHAAAVAHRAAGRRREQQMRGEQAARVAGMVMVVMMVCVRMWVCVCGRCCSRLLAVVVIRLRLLRLWLLLLLLRIPSAGCCRIGRAVLDVLHELIDSRLGHALQTTSGAFDFSCKSLAYDLQPLGEHGRAAQEGLVERGLLLDAFADALLLAQSIAGHKLLVEGALLTQKAGQAGARWSNSTACFSNRSSSFLCSSCSRCCGRCVLMKICS